MSPAHEHLTIPRELAERWPASTIESSQCGTADVGEDEAPDTMALRRLRNRLNVEMATDSSGEPYGAIPRRRLGEHEMRPSCPARELVEFRRPHYRHTGPLDPVATGRVTGVNHRSVHDVKAAPAEGPRVWDEAAFLRQPPDWRDEFAPLVSHEPRVELDPRDRPRSAVDHDAHTGMCHEQAGRGVSRRGLCADAECDELHARSSPYAPHGKRG